MITIEDLIKGGLFKCVGDGCYMKKGELCEFSKNTGTDRENFLYRMKVLNGSNSGFTTCWRWCDDLEYKLEKVE